MWEDNAQVQAIIIIMANTMLAAVEIIVAGICAVGKHLQPIVCKELTVNGFIHKTLATIKQLGNKNQEKSR